MDEAILNGYEDLKQAITHLANIRMNFLNDMPKPGKLNRRISQLVDNNLNTAIADLANLGNLLGDIYNNNCDEFDTELLLGQFEESQKFIKKAV